MTEGEFQTQVLELARLGGWSHYHTFDSRKSVAGFPDLVLVRGNRILFIELKSDRGKVTPEQRAWLDRLEQAVPLSTDVWYPRDLPQIERLLLDRTTVHERSRP